VARQKHAGQEIAPWTLAHLKDVLAADKDAQHERAIWSPAYVGGHLLTADLNFGVRVLGHELLIHAKWKTPSDHQVFLQVPDASWNIARLCRCKQHADVHWHYFQGAPGIRETRKAAPGAPNAPTAMDDFVTYFIKEQHIVNSLIEGTLFP
jgi:hypothetical protein